MSKYRGSLTKEDVIRSLQRQKEGLGDFDVAIIDSLITQVQEGGYECHRIMGEVNGHPVENLSVPVFFGENKNANPKHF